MSPHISVVNIGALAIDGGIVDTTIAVGQQAAVAAPLERSQLPRADVGILTVLSEECRAVVDVLRTHRDFGSLLLAGGPRVYRAEVRAEGGGDLRVVAMQTLEPGPQSAAAAYHRLRDAFRPPVVLLVGVAGGIRCDLGIGDVVIGEEVIYYDARRETQARPRRRGKSLPATPALRHRVNDFFLRNGSTIRLRNGGSVRVFRGPVGTGSAVVTDEHSDIVEFLQRFNEKTLAVETEAGGVGQAFYEEIDADRGLAGWLTVRGISDLANRHKAHAHHQLASRHAAAVVDRLLPLLGLPTATATPRRPPDHGLTALAEPA